MAVCDPKIRVGDENTKLEVELLENCIAALAVDTATVKTITVARPDDTIFTRAAAFTNTGTDGLIYILSIDTDFTMSGTYYIQAYVETPGWRGHSDIGEFEVFENLVSL